MRLRPGMRLRPVVIGAVRIAAAFVWPAAFDGWTVVTPDGPRRVRSPAANGGSSSPGWGDRFAAAGWVASAAAGPAAEAAVLSLQPSQDEAAGPVGATVPAAR